MIVREDDLEFSLFSCCGDEDLYPFQCPADGRCMVFCYECDTLYANLSDTRDRGRDGVNHFDPSRPIFSCPSCGFEFEYEFMENPSYRVTRHDWVAAGFSNLLADSSEQDS